MWAHRSIENGPADRNHTALIFASRFPIQCERKAMMFVLQIIGTDVTRVQRRRKQNQSWQQQRSKNHGALNLNLSGETIRRIVLYIF